MNEVSREPRRALGYRRAVGIMLLSIKREVFVAQRIDVTGEAWQMPQGGIDEGESPREAVYRELKEEIGTDQAELLAESRRWLFYDLPTELRTKVWGGRYRGQRQKWFLMRFTGADEDIALETTHAEFSAWKWVTPRELPRLIVPFKRQLYLEVLEEFRSHLDM